ncbi:MAG: deoxyribose-phosphate aldolase [Anaerolineales bacterium]|nr:deoxyribose-phosphate aldolase [Anaerolineales bacterium]
MHSLAGVLELAEAYERELPPPPTGIKPPQGAQIAAWIDHTLLKPEATASQIKGLCQEALKYHFASVCVNPAYVSLAAGLLAGSPVAVCTVVGFPLGATLPTQKVIETLACLSNGASEIDMVLNIGALKGQAYGQVLNEIDAVAQVAHNQGAILKVILETALLTREEKIIACLICKAAGADFVKTSTGFGPGGATVEDVDLMVRTVGPERKVKAAGGIRDLATALAMIGAGASRLGASAGVQIVDQASA